MFEIGKKGAPERGSDGFARTEGRAETASARPAAPGREVAVIGPSIHIDGDVRGEEDLLIEGEINGTLQLNKNSLTIGAQGKVRADVYAHSIYVDGTVEGDLIGAERVHIRKNAQVRGNVTSPRVSLEDGAKFKGSIEMDPQAVQAASAARTGAKPVPAVSAPKPISAPPKAEPPTVVKTGAAN